MKARSGQRAISAPMRQNGATAVEFALVAALFFTLLFGLIEMGRVLFYWNSAAEATRLGARLAVVCDMHDPDIVARMRNILPIIPADQIQIGYLPASCTAATCTSVTVSIGAGVPVDTFIPFVPLALTLPPFSTSLPRESMSSTDNPVCS